MRGNKSNILLEVGTNELEVLEFTIAGKHFGINVAKVVELMQIQPPQSIPHSHPCIEGVFKPRGDVYTILDLSKYLALGPSAVPEKDIYIIANFNQMFLAFHVHTVENIHRISWEAIEGLDDIVYGAGDGVVTGIAKIDGRLISILDFEKITYDVCPETGIQMSDIPDTIAPPKDLPPILIAEDSVLLRKMLLQALNSSGFTNVTVTTNGLEAWEHLHTLKDNGRPILQQVSCVITDIEMPRMDGHHLTHLIKNDAVLSELPVLIFSSLINDALRLKGQEVGADAQLSKPEIGKLLEVVTQLIEQTQ